MAMRKLKFFLLGIAIGIVVALVAFDLSFPAIDPSVWRAYAEATGVCPPTTVTSVLWSKLVSLGLDPILLSALSVGVLMVAVFGFIWRILAILVCPSSENRNWWRMTIPFVSFLGCALTAFSEPVWRMTLSGSPTVMTLALFMLACDLFLVPLFIVTIVDEFDEPNGLVRQSHVAYAAFLLSGALFVEMPIAIVLPVLFLIACKKVFPRVRDDRYREHPDDVYVFMEVDFSKPVAVCCWLVGLAGAVSCSGVLQIGLQRYFWAQVRDVTVAVSPGGWILWIACTLVPFVAVCRLLPMQTARTGRWTFGRVVLAILIAVVSLAVVSPLARGGWAFVSNAVVRAPLMQALGAAFAALAAALALALFSYCAFHAVDYGRRSGGVVVSVVVLALTLAFALAVAGVRRESAAQVRQAIADAMEETVREAEGLPWVLTDGSADVGVELAARRHHHKLVTRPPVSDDAPELQDGGAQTGFDLWKSAGQPAPQASGLLARSSWPDGACERGIAYVKLLNARMTALVDAGALSREKDPQVAEVFRSILRCMSRMADAREAGGML